MGKDKKGKGDKKPKKSSGVTYYQAITGYKITIEEKELETARDEFYKLTEKKYNLEQRNQRLKDTREFNFQKAMDEFREFKDGIRLQKPCEREEVVLMMKSLWLEKQAHDNVLLDLKKEMRKLDREIHVHKKELKKWTDYRETGQSNLDTHIKLLNEEIVSMNANFEVITASLKENLVTSMGDIDKNADEMIKRKQEIAAEKAFKDIDEKAIVQTKDNEWMNEKILIFTKELEDLKQEHSALEKENISLMSYLFECSTDDLKCLKSGYEDQFLDNENLETNNILNVDLTELESVRPTSRLGITLEKIKEIELKNESDNQLAIYRQYEEPEEKFPNSNEYLTLGAVDYKALSMDGVRKPLIRGKTPTKAELKALEYTEEEWPVTHHMLRGALRRAVISDK